MSTLTYRHSHNIYVHIPSLDTRDYSSLQHTGVKSIYKPRNEIIMAHPMSRRPEFPCEPSVTCHLFDSPSEKNSVHSLAPHGP
eukprot:5832157-Amphidinium_carterae.1